MYSISYFWNFLLDFIFPTVCVNCKTYTEDRGFICKNCFLKIEIFSGMFCGKCKARLPEGRKVCHKDMPYTLGAATFYENDVVRSMVHGLKFRNLNSLVEPMSQILLSYAKQENIEGDIVIPIPLGRKRERERGYNQAKLLAQKFSEEIGIPLGGSLKRIKETKPQSETENREERIKNVSDSFEVQGNLRGKRIILIDDVTTSGSTFFSASRALKKAGARSILALAFARA